MSYNELSPNNVLENDNDLYYMAFKEEIPEISRKVMSTNDMDLKMMVILWYMKFNISKTGKYI